MRREDLVKKAMKGRGRGTVGRKPKEDRVGPMPSGGTSNRPQMANTSPPPSNTGGGNRPRSREDEMVKDPGKTPPRTPVRTRREYRAGPAIPKTSRYKKGGMACGGKSKKAYAKGGKVRGAGICKKGVRKAKMY